MHPQLRRVFFIMFALQTSPTFGDDQNAAVDAGFNTEISNHAPAADVLIQYLQDDVFVSNGNRKFHAEIGPETDPSLAASYHAKAHSGRTPATHKWGLGVSADASRSTTDAAYTYGIAVAFLRDSLSAIHNTGAPIFVFGYTIEFEVDGKATVLGHAQVSYAAAAAAEGFGRQTGFAGVDKTWNEPVVLDELRQNLDVGHVMQLIAYPDEHFVTIDMIMAVIAFVRPGAFGVAKGDFYTTMNVSNVQLFDEQGEVIPGVRIFGESGVEYPYNVASVPEPPSLISVIGVSAFLLSQRRRCALCKS